MGDLFLLSERQMARIAPHFPLSHGVPRVDDRRVASGIVQSVIAIGCAPYIRA
jgi:transposase